MRIVDIKAPTLCTDGGTHVASTRQIGRMRVVKVENKARTFNRARVPDEAVRNPRYQRRDVISIFVPRRTGR